jgi:hypothetical protein
VSGAVAVAVVFGRRDLDSTHTCGACISPLCVAESVNVGHNGGVVGDQRSAGADFGLQKIPLVTIKVLKDGHGTIRFFARRLVELNAASLEFAVVAPEIVGMQEGNTGPLV